MRHSFKDSLFWFICLILPLPFESTHAFRKHLSQHKDGFLDFHFLTEPQDQVIGPEPAVFKCLFDVRPGVRVESTVKWRKDGVLYDAKNEVELLNNSLVIEKPSRSDSGIYQCVVRIKHDSTEWIYLSRKAKLLFPKLGNFAQQPISQKIFKNQFVAFRCALDAETTSQFSSLFQFEWFHNNQRVRNESNRINILPVTHTLEISNAQREDSGNFTCIVRNGHENITSQTAFLDVLEGTVPNGAISFALQPKFQTVKEGGQILLECLANGSPKPNVTWLYKNYLIDEKLAKYQRVGVDQSSLLVSNVQMSDSGLYSCKASNSEDTTDAAANVVVQTMPRIFKALNSFRLQETMDVEFECGVKSGIQVTWYKNGEPIRSSEYFVINDNRLKIYGLIRDDQGVYQCFANEDEANNVQTSAQLMVYEAALTQALIGDESMNEVFPPSGLHAQSIGARSIRLKWDPSIALSPVTNLMYSVYYRAENSTSENFTNSSTPSLTLIDLEPNTLYSIRVQALDPRGKSGKSSTPITLRTKTEDVEVGEVRNLRVQLVGADSAQIEWDPPIMSTPRNLRYKFFYRRLNTAHDEEEIQSVVVKTSYALHSLRKNAEYSARVQVVDGSNSGASSPSIHFRTYSDVPDGPPTNIKLDAPEFGTLRIRWAPPSSEQQNGNLTSYKIRYKTKGRSSKSLITMASADLNEHLITGLETGLMYQVRIAAQNLNGTGPFSEWVTAELPAEDQADEVAPAPSELKVFAGYDSIHVSWSPPQEPSVMIQGYLVGWGVYVPDREKANVGPDDHEFTIKGLKPNRDYVISVRAITRAGDGFPIYETVKTTSYAKPSTNMEISNDDATQFAKGSSLLVPPMGVQAESISSSSIRVSWTDPNNVFNQFYSVRYSHSGNTDQTWRYVNTSESEVLVDGLQPNTQYEFAVRLIESQQWSMSALTRTQSSPPSSAPRDLTVLPTYPTERDNPNSVMVSWQPPKYANGDVEEYVIFYSDRLDLPDRDWIIDSAKGDRLSIKISDLLPRSTYYFKIQARNIKGYGPLSPVVTFVPGRLGSNSLENVFNQVDTTSRRSNAELLELIIEVVRENLIYVVVGTCVSVFCIVLLTICLCKRSPKEKIRRHDGYIAGHKLSSINRDNGPDCWIAHPSNRVELLSGPPVNQNHELKQFATCAVDSPPPRYQTHHGLVRSRVPTVSFAVDRQINRKSLPPLSVNTMHNYSSIALDSSPARRPVSHRGILRSSTTTKNNSNSMINSITGADPSLMTRSSYESTSGADSDNPMFGNLYVSRRLSTYSTVYDSLSTTRKLSKEDKEQWRRTLIEPPIGSKQENVDECRCNAESSSSNSVTNGTISRNYHQSTVSLETRQKTPQILYTGTNRQHINKIDLSSDRGSSFGGSNTILQMSSTPPLVGEAGYQTVRQGNPLRSFVQMNVPPPIDRISSSQSPINQPEQRMASVRPVVVATGANIRPAGIVIGQRSTATGLAPVGLAHAQPRVNVANIYSPYQSTIGSKEDIRTQHTNEPDQCKETERPMSTNSAEIVNPQQFDKMINTLQQLQHQFEN